MPKPKPAAKKPAAKKPAARKPAAKKRRDAAFVKAVTSGDRLQALEALRRKLAEAIAAGPPARDLAALSTRLEVVMSDIEKLRRQPGAGAQADDLGSRRAARAAKARGGA